MKQTTVKNNLKNIYGQQINIKVKIKTKLPSYVISEYYLLAEF